MANAETRSPEPGSSSCPPAGELAALAEGRISGQQRTRLMGHVEACEDCYEIFTGTVDYLERTSPAEREQVEPPRARLLRFPRSAATRSLLAGAIAASFIAILVMQPWKPGEPTPMRIGGLTQPLLEPAGATQPGERPAMLLAQVQLGSPLLGFAPGLEDRERAFRVGVRMVDLQVAIAAASEAHAATLSQTLAGLIQPIQPLSAVAERLETRPPATASELDALEQDLTGHLAGPWVGFGAWAESARLAASVGDRDYFAQPEIEAATEQIPRSQLSVEAEDELAQVQQLMALQQDDDLERLLQSLELLIARY